MNDLDNNFSFIKIIHKICLIFYSTVNYMPQEWSTSLVLQKYLHSPICSLVPSLKGEFKGSAKHHVGHAS